VNKCDNRKASNLSGLIDKPPLIKLIYRSIGTSLILSATFFVSFLVARVLPETPIVLYITTLKGISPILTTIANFGKIQSYWTNFAANVKRTFNFN
jgi:hypothetical protein